MNISIVLLTFSTELKTDRADFPRPHQCCYFSFLAQLSDIEQPLHPQPQPPPFFFFFTILHTIAAITAASISDIITVASIFTLPFRLVFFNYSLTQLTVFVNTFPTLIFPKKSSRRNFCSSPIGLSCHKYLCPVNCSVGIFHRSHAYLLKIFIKDIGSVTR